MLLLQQVKALREKGWDCFVAILSGKNEMVLVEQLSLNHDHLMVFQSPYSVLNMGAIRFGWKHYQQLAALVKEKQIRNIVAHLPLAHFWGRLVKRKQPTSKLIVYHHSMQYQASPLDTFPKKIFNSLQKMLARKADDVAICISESVKKNIAAHFVLNNPVVLYNAVADKYAEVMGSKRGESKSIRLLLPGRLHPAKGHLFFLPVFERIVKEHMYDVQLEIAGGGNLEHKIRDFIEAHNLQQYTHITGFLSNEELLKRIAAADLIIIPSVSEGLGIVGIESLMMGKTVIASNAGGLPEIFRHRENGYLFEAGNNTSCLNIMLSVLSDYPASVFPSQQLRQEYLERFEFEQYADRFEALLGQ
jgi:glycosyltransferase involved in cell wall biosynthesis